jgi:hypothetical protein
VRRSPAWLAVFALALVYAVASGHWQSVFSLLLRVL